jgi:hypothetical protein
MNRMKMGKGERQAKPKTLKSIEVRKAEPDELEHGSKGGHVVIHHFDNQGPGEYHDSEKHGFPEGQGQEMMAHIGEHMDVPSEAEGAETGENTEMEAA